MEGGREGWREGGREGGRESNSVMPKVLAVIKLPLPEP